ncbi:MAG: TolC family protein [Bacteroidetes bacterium]|nr:TolC family protein [Bacteroidota bacterium]
MKTINRHVSLILFPFLFVGLAAAGTDSAAVEVMLPALKRVQDAAVANSPLLKREHAAVTMRQREQEINNFSWLKGLSVDAASQYGSYGDQSVNKLYLGNRIGATVKISLDELFNWSDRNDKDEAAIAVAEYNRQNLEREVRGIVTGHYAKVQTLIRLVSIAADAYHNALTIQQNAELKFRSGELGLYDYSRILDLVTTSTMSLERLRGDLQQEWMLLEEITGVPLAVLRGAP